MKRWTLIAAMSAVAFQGVATARGDNTPALRIICDNYWNTDASPTAATGGRVFIDSGSGPVLWHDLAYDDPSWTIANDLNIELLAGATSTNLAHIALDPSSLYVPWPGHSKADYTSIWLRDVGTGANPPVEVPNAGNYNMSWFSVTDPFPAGSKDGTFMDWSTFDQPYVIPGTDGMDHAYFRIRIWTGNSTTYPSFAAAAAGGQYVADTGVIYRHVESSPLMPPNDLGDVMPAMVLKQALSGDANLDGIVDVTDLSKVLTNYNKTAMQWGDGDFDGNGSVDVTDLSKVLTNYNKTSAAGAGVSAVPEPGTFVLLGAGLAGLAVCRRRRLVAKFRSGNTI